MDIDKKKEAKLKDFISEYGKLVEKHQVDFANFPMFVPDERGGFRVIIQSTPIDLEEQKKAQLDKAFIGK